MRKIFSILFALALALSFSLVMATPVAAASTWYVDPGGTDDGSHGTGPGTNAFQTIQYAINDARVTNGDTINVAAGTYQEDITINKELTLQGAGRTTATIQRNASVSQVVLIQADNVKTDGFKIDGGAAHLCSNIVKLSTAGSPPYENIEITNCHILHSANSAVYLSGKDEDSIGNGYKVNDNIIEYFAAHNGEAGVEVNFALDVEVKRNTITNSNADPSRHYTYGGTGVYFFDYSGGTISDNTFSKCCGAIIINSNVEPVYVDNNTISQCYWGVVEGESFAKIHITNNAIATWDDPGIGSYDPEIGILLGGDGDYYDSCPPYSWQVDNLQHEVSGNTITGTLAAEVGSIGIYVQPGWWDRDWGASGTVIGNTITNYDIGLQVYGQEWGGGLDLTSHVHVSFGFNNIVSCTTDGAVSDWSGADGGIDATCNWWGAVTGPDAISAKYDYSPWWGASYLSGTAPNIVLVAHPWSWYTNDSIQDAIDAASAGDTINVAAGTYDEQVVITKSLILQGVGDTTIVKPSSAVKLTQVFTGLFWYGGTKNIAGIIVANVAGGSVTIKNLKVDESLVGTKPAGADYLAGIFYRETGGVVDTVTIAGTGAWSTTDRAYGMYLSAGTNTVSVEVKGSTITNYDKNGIEAMGSTLTVNVHHNTITGRGVTPSGDEVQNGVSVGRDAVATVNYNTISDLAYYTVSSVATGILIYHYVTPTGKSATANGNTITNCQVGIMFKNANGVAQDNIVSGGTVGLDGIFTQPNYAGAYTASFVHNTVSGITKNAAIDAETYATLTPGTGATLTVTITNNTLTGGFTTADGIYVGGGAGGVTATISDNTISGWPEHGINLGDACVAGATITGNTIINNAMSGLYIGAAVNAANVGVHFNNIVGNTLYGANNAGTGTLDALYNWWGDETGPSHDLNLGGQGDAVSDNVDFSPWLYKTQEQFVSGAPCYAGSVVLENEATEIEPDTYAGGWNSFSTPITLDGSADTVSELLALTAGSGLFIERAQRFDLASQAWVPVIMGNVVVENYQIKPGEGLFIQVSSGGSIPILVKTTPTSPPMRNLVAGWNLIGMSSLGAETVTTALSGVSYSVVLSPKPPNDVAWSVPPAGAGDKELLLGEAYWVAMGGPGILFGFTTTPVADDMTWELNQ